MSYKLPSIDIANASKQTQVQQGILVNSNSNKSSLYNGIDLVERIQYALNDLDNVSITGAKEANSDQLPVLEVSRMENADIPSQVWELDGLFKVYLQKIGRVSYLHIDSSMHYRQPTILDEYQLPDAVQVHSSNIGKLSAATIIGNPESSSSVANNKPQYFLKAYPFQQLRRVISKQIHYFDHPMFGMVVQIRRYQIPDYMN